MERNDVLNKLARGRDKWFKSASEELPTWLRTIAYLNEGFCRNDVRVVIPDGSAGRLIYEDHWRERRIELGLEKKVEEEVMSESKSDGSTASYYELPAGCTELQDLISHRNLNAQDGEMFRAIYRKGRASHSDELRDAKKVLFYAQAEVERLEKLKGVQS